MSSATFVVKPYTICNWGYIIRNLSTKYLLTTVYFCNIKKQRIKRPVIMSKKVLILSSSPRREGNSDTLCDEFMRGAIEARNEAEKVFSRICIGGSYIR